VVYPKPSVETGGTSLMDVVDVECSEEIKVEVQLEGTDHCIEVSTNVTLEFFGEPAGSNSTDTIAYFEDRFEMDVESGAFLDLIVPPSTKREFRATYSAADPPSAGNAMETVEPVPPVVADDNGEFDADEFLQQAEDAKNPGGAGGDGEGGGSNAAGIAAGVCIGFLVVGVAGFFVYRNRVYGRFWWADDKSHDGDENSRTNRDGRESYSTPEFGREDGANDLRGRADDDGSEASSRDQISSGGSDSDSSSMASFSGTSESDDSSSSGSTSSSSSSSSSNDSVEGTSRVSLSSYQTSVSGAGPASLASSTTSGDAPPKGDARGDESNSLRDRAGKRNVARASAALTNSGTPTEDDSSAGSSGWDSSDGESSVDSASVDSYTGDLDSSKDSKSRR